MEDDRAAGNMEREEGRKRGDKNIVMVLQDVNANYGRECERPRYRQYTMQSMADGNKNVLII